MPKIALGSSREVTQPDCVKALIVEFIATFFFVFAGVGSAIAADVLSGSALLGLFVVALTHAFIVAVTISGGHISGGHLNPAVTLGLLCGGHITVWRSVMYIIDQLVASTTACLLLKYLSSGQATPVFVLANGTGPIQGVVWEIVLTFSLLFTVYGTMVDPRRDPHVGLGPILVGFVVGANIIAGGAFSGASMNPARSFGPALVSWDWTNQWVYWVGPLVGGGLAGFVYECSFIDRSHQPLQNEDGVF